MSISGDYLESGYLELNSDESLEVLGPIVGNIKENDMVVVACRVTVFFEVYQQGWFSQGRLIKSDVVTEEMNWVREVRQSLQEQENNKIKMAIFKELLPTISSTDPKTIPTLVFQCCKWVRQKVETEDKFLALLMCAGSGKDVSEIMQKLEQLTVQEQALKADIRQKIQDFTDLELFQWLQPLWANLMAMSELGEELEVTPKAVMDQECFKFFQRYHQAMEKVRNQAGAKQLTEIKVEILLAKRSNLREGVLGHYHAANRQPGEWTWEQVATPLSKLI